MNDWARQHMAGLVAQTMAGISTLTTEVKNGTKVGLRPTLEAERESRKARRTLRLMDDAYEALRALAVDSGFRERCGIPMVRQMTTGQILAALGRVPVGEDATADVLDFQDRTSRTKVLHNGSNDDADVGHDEPPPAA